MFPSLKDDGPIEAGLWRMSNSAHASFPSLKDDGPIEAIFRTSTPRTIIVFPSLKDDGPIEAISADSFASVSVLVSVVERRRPH